MLEFETDGVFEKVVPGRQDHFERHEHVFLLSEIELGQFVQQFGSPPFAIQGPFLRRFFLSLENFLIVHVVAIVQ